MTTSSFGRVVGGVVLCVAAPAAAQQVGSIRGVVFDKDFDAPLPLATVEILGSDKKVVANDEGIFVFPEVPAGTYTLAFSKDGYTRQLVPNVLVSAGQVRDVDASLAGEFTDMDEFVVQDVQIGGSESALLQLRFESPALLDSIGSELMSRAGASDAASALRLIPGATVQDGRFAVIRGLPPRYTSSQLNSVVLPSADEDTRAVQLDQFPAAVIQSVQVTKSFTPDQPGDASGGAVNVILKGIPDESIVQFSAQTGFNSQVRDNRNDFLTYDGGGVDAMGSIGADRAIQTQNLGRNWNGAVGTTRGTAPTEFKWNLTLGTRQEVDDGVVIGGLLNFFYERDNAFYDNGIDDAWWVVGPGNPMSPQTVQGVPEPGGGGDFKTRLFNVTQSTQSVQWGGLGTVGLETEHHKLAAVYLYSRTTEDTATLAEDTRGKEYFFPGYDVNDPSGPGNQPGDRQAAPYLRTQTLAYEQRETSSFQLRGSHVLPFDEPDTTAPFAMLAPEIDWVFAKSDASSNEPDKRQFGSQWWASSLNPGAPPFLPPFTDPALYLPFKPAANFTLGNLQRTFTTIEEDSTQFQANLKLPFRQWTDNEGAFRFGLYNDSVTRRFDQETFSNFNDNAGFEEPDFRNFWTTVWPSQNHPITAGPPFVDVDYRGEQKIKAGYGMVELPLNEYLTLVGGARYESTSISIENFPEEDATWFPPGATAPVQLNPGDADARFRQNDWLPSLTAIVKPIEQVTVRGSWTRTVARPVFKELSPIQQQEFLGGDVFIGNPDLRMSAVENWDLRLDFTPFANGIFSVSWFRKDIENPIEYVQRIAPGFGYTFPVNFPEATIKGWELEARQDLGTLWEPLLGLSLGANATFIDSEAILPADEAAGFDLPNIAAPTSTRAVTGAPEFLYNLFVTYDVPLTGTQLSLFYTVQGDTLVAGATQSDGNYVPDVYALERGILNLTVSQKIGDVLRFQFQAKNLTDSATTTVYRSRYITEDVLKTTYTSGIDYSFQLSASFAF